MDSDDKSGLDGNWIRRHHMVHVTQGSQKSLSLFADLLRHLPCLEDEYKRTRVSGAISCRHLAPSIGSCRTVDEMRFVMDSRWKRPNNFVQTLDAVGTTIRLHAVGIPQELVTLVTKYAWSHSLIPSTMRCIRYGGRPYGVWMHENETVYQWMEHYIEESGIEHFRMLLVISDNRVIRLLRPFQTWKQVEEEYGCDMNFATIHVLSLLHGDEYYFAADDVEHLARLRNKEWGRIVFWTARQRIEGLTEEEMAMILSRSPEGVEAVSTTVLAYERPEPVFQLLLQMNVTPSEITWNPRVFHLTEPPEFP